MAQLDSQLDPSTSTPQNLRRTKAVVFATSAIAIGIGTLFQPLVFTGDALQTVTTVHLAWSVLFAVIAALLAYSTVSAATLGFSAVAISFASVAVLTKATGGSTSPLFPVITALPLIAAAAAPDRPAATLISLIAAPTLTFWFSAEAGLAEAAFRSLTCASIGAIGAVATTRYRKLREAQARADASRYEAVVQLAQSERKRQHVERLALIGQMAAGVAHEINNPLSYVKGNLTFALEQTSLPRPDLIELRDALQDAAEGANRIREIVADLSDFARADESAERCCIHEVISEALKIAAHRTDGVRICIDAEPDVPEVMFVRRRLLQVMSNLIANAGDALAAADTPDPSIRISVRRLDAEFVAVSVRDNGPGIEPATATRIFEPFFTTKPPGKGTGLGLSLCREMMDRAGGSLVVEPNPGSGAEFIARFPTTPAETNRARASAHTTAPAMPVAERPLRREAEQR